MVVVDARLRFRDVRSCARARGAARIGRAFRRLALLRVLERRLIRLQVVLRPLELRLERRLCSFEPGLLFLVAVDTALDRRGLRLQLSDLRRGVRERLLGRGEVGLRCRKLRVRAVERNRARGDVRVRRLAGELQRTLRLCRGRP